MPTPTVNGRLKSAFVVLSGIDEFRTVVVPKLAARPTVEGQPEMNHGEVLDNLRGQLAFAYNNLFQKDHAYVLELSDDEKYFLDRDEAGRGLRRVMIDSRGIFFHCFRPPKIEEYGFPASVSRDPEALYQEGRALDLRLREPDLSVPTPWSPKFVVEPVALADEIRPWVVKLEAVLEHVRRERREATMARQARHAAIEFFDDTFLWVSRTCESLFNLAGEKELARRVRPSTTRPGQTEEDPDDTGQDVPDFDDVDPDEPLPGSDDPTDDDDGGNEPPSAPPPAPPGQQDR